MTDDDPLMSARALVLHDLQALGKADPQGVSVLEKALSERRWWVSEWPEGAAYVAGQVAQDVQDALLDSVGRWPLCKACDDVAPHRAPDRPRARARPPLGVRARRHGGLPARRALRAPARSNASALSDDVATVRRYGTSRASRTSLGRPCGPHGRRRHPRLARPVPGVPADCLDPWRPPRRRRGGRVHVAVPLSTDVRPDVRRDPARVRHPPAHRPGEGAARGHRPVRARGVPRGRLPERGDVSRRFAALVGRSPSDYRRGVRPLLVAVPATASHAIWTPRFVPLCFTAGWQATGAVPFRPAGSDY